MLRLAVSLCNLLFNCYFMFKSWFRIVSFNISDLYLPDLECSETLMWLTAELLLSIILSYSLNNCVINLNQNTVMVLCAHSVKSFIFCFVLPSTTPFLCCIKWESQTKSPLIVHTWEVQNLGDPKSSKCTNQLVEVDWKGLNKHGIIWCNYVW